MAPMRRARPLLGTLVEVGAWTADEPAVQAAFDAIARLQARLSRFEPGSELSRFHALEAGQSLDIAPDSAQLLQSAWALHLQSDGLFDITQGTGPADWHVVGLRLHKRSRDVRLDLGGIAKGHAVDLAVAALQSHHVVSGWVNAGGDLRAFGDAELPIHLRDEVQGGVRAFARLSDGAFASSVFAGRHVSVAAPSCRWADALTKVVAGSGNATHRLLAQHGAQAFIH